ASPTPLITAPDAPPPPAPVFPLPTQPRRRGFWVTGGAIAAALIVGLGFNNYRLWNALQVAQTEINQTDSVTYSLTSPEATSTASASVIVHPKTLEAQVKAQGLTALPPGQVYAVWTLPEPDFPATTDAKGAILTGVFQVDAAGSAATTISVPAVHRHPEAIAKVAITVEDANAPQQHTGSVIIITQ
ncbi:MAG: anti-sigma factor, partial [Cyanobacteria bacterium P01_F01_bin.86]